MTLADEFFDDLADKNAGPWRLFDFPAPAGRITVWRGTQIADEHTARPYIPDEQGRRWLLDGSGDVA